MADNNQNNTDEIDLGQLLHLIRRGLNSIFKWILGVFVFIKRNALILLGLAILGAAAGYGLNKIVTKRIKSEVILKPSLESKEYLYNVVNEIQANIEGKDSEFFQGIGIDLDQMNSFSVEIEPIENSNASKKDDNLEYLELLEKFQKEDLVGEVIKAEIIDKSPLNHRLTIFFKDREKGAHAVQQILAYINKNPYLNELVSVQRKNAEERIAQNQRTIAQIDELLALYSKKMAAENQSDGRIVLDTEGSSDIGALLSEKRNLVRDTEQMRLGLLEDKEPITIMNIGKPHEIRSSLFGKQIIFIPIVLISLFLLFKLFVYFDKKSKEYGI